MSALFLSRSFPPSRTTLGGKTPKANPADYLSRIIADEKPLPAQWEHIDRVAPRFKRHLPILQGVEFAAPSTDDPLIEAVHFLKAAFPKGKPLGHYAETAALSESDRTSEGDAIDNSRYRCGAQNYS